MPGRQTGPLVFFEGDRPAQVFPPSGRRLEIDQVHIFRVKNGQVVEHLARRDDLGMMQQLGHLPPRPPLMLRILFWKLSGRAERAGREVAQAAARAAAAVEALLASNPRGSTVE